MKSDLEPAKEVLRAFLSEIAEVEKIRQSISAPIFTPFQIKDQMPDLSEIEFAPAPDNFWVEDNAYIWIYAEAWHYRNLMAMPKNNIVPAYYLQPSLPLYEEWKNQEKEVIFRGTIIPQPENISLGDYLVEIASHIQDKNEKRAVWHKSLKSFLQYIREDIDFDLQGSLECIFPYKMKIHHSYSLERHGGSVIQVKRSHILRNIEKPVYPIDILATADILKNLAIAALEDRPNAQHTAAETLGFAWLCLAVGSARLMTKEKIVYATPLSAFKANNQPSEPTFFQPKYCITIQTFHGQKIRAFDVPTARNCNELLHVLKIYCPLKCCLLKRVGQKSQLIIISVGVRLYWPDPRHNYYHRRRLP